MGKRSVAVVAMVFYDVDRMLMRAKKKIVTTRIMSHVCAAVFNREQTCGRVVG